MSFLASCPENAFQRVPPGYAPFSPAQRAGAVLRNGTKLLGVGFGASLIGVTFTNVLIGVRQQLDPSFAPPNAPQVGGPPRQSIHTGIHEGPFSGLVAASACQGLTTAGPICIACVCVYDGCQNGGRGHMPNARDVTAQALLPCTSGHKARALVTAWGALLSCLALFLQPCGCSQYRGRNGLLCLCRLSQHGRRLWGFPDTHAGVVTPAQDVLTMSAAYGSYMAISSNLRYQILAGVIEERGIESVFAGNPALCSALSFVVRTSNTFLGSLMWVDYLRLLGLQKAAEGGH